MYHPDVIAASARRIAAQPVYAPYCPDGLLPIYPIDQTAEIVAHLAEAWDPEKNLATRPLLAPEWAFVMATRLRCQIDAPYFLERFVAIDQEGHGLRPLYPLWESQRCTMDKLAQLQRERLQSKSPDGLLLNVLKARQLGVSTLSEALVAHRLFFTPHCRALCGADVEDQAAYLWSMVDRIYDQLPWFLRPGKVTRVKGRELSFTNGSTLKSAWGKSTRGELQDVTGRQKGHIGRGKTFSVVHISELSTWDNPGQLDDALFAAIPMHPHTLVILESTAKGAGNWWHHHWQAGEEGIGRFVNMFIPWGAEPSKYTIPAPDAWTPAPTTTAQQVRAETIWPRYLGHPITLTDDQLYFYERTRAYFEKKNDIAKFFEEYASDPEECFLYSGRSVFTHLQLERLDQLARPLIDVWRVEPAADIASLKRDTSPDPHPLHLGDRRPAPPPSLRQDLPQATSLEAIPAGYGFRRIPKGPELAAVPSLREGVFAIWEYPRKRGRPRYILSVDVSDGVGQDYSVATVIRLPTIEEPAEDVAQFCSRTHTPSQFAFICDAIGRYYVDHDGVEACAAIECNNHGLSVQDTLQLHLGYSHFYVWEYADSASPDRRFSTRIGWLTTSRTRPLLLDKFYEAVTNEDPISLLPDMRVNSPVTRGEMRHLLIPNEPGATLGDAAAASGQHDDAIFSSAIGYYVAYRHAGGEAEPIAERRRRRLAAQAQAETLGQGRPDYRNMAFTADEADHSGDTHGEDADDLTFDPRATIDW